MKCSACNLLSTDLRAYARLAHGGTPDLGPPVRLCPACRVLNSLHPRYQPLVPLTQLPCAWKPGSASD